MSDSPENQDARTLTIVRSSGLVRLLDRAVTLMTAAWHDSSVRRITPRRVDLPVAGVVMMSASITAIVLQRFATRPGPLTWIVPALFLTGGLCLLVLPRVRTPRP